MSNIDSHSLTLGLSPCPNDTFIFHALLHGLVQASHPHKMEFSPLFSDVENLNRMAVSGKLQITKLSLGAIPSVVKNYSLLSSGAALGWGCGPLVVSKKPARPEELENAVMAIPGKMTTANLLLDLHGGFKGERREMIFSEIIPAIARGEVDAGVIIHEGRFTYQDHGLFKVEDLGQWWEDKFHLPLPLGIIACRRDIPADISHAIEKSIADSVDYAWRHPEASKNFIKSHAQELDDKITGSHIATFVTAHSHDLGDIGRSAILALLGNSITECGELFLDK